MGGTARLARYRRPLEDVYLPFVYCERVKRPGKGFFFKTVLADDWLVLTLALAWTAPLPMAAALGLLLLMFAFWTIYEIGYEENDRVAHEKEADPTLRAEYFATRPRMPRILPWIWALAFSLTGSIALSVQDLRLGAIVTIGAGWMAILIVTRALFWVYNHVDKRSRAWMYLGLQVARTLGVLIFLPASIVGVVALTSQVISRWAMYLVYRLGPGSWPGTGATHLARLLIFAVFSSAMLAAAPKSILTYQLLAVFSWFVIRARNGIRDVVTSVGRIS
jgi:hypothetical protein